MCGHEKGHWNRYSESAEQRARVHAYAGQRVAAEAAGSAAPDLAPDPDLLIGDVERERVVEALKQATADGRLTIDEFTERVGETYAARTLADLRHVLRQLPQSVRAAAEPFRPTPPPPAPATAPYPRHRRSGHPVLVAAVVALIVIALTGGEVFVLWPLFCLLFVFRRLAWRRA